MYFRQVKLTSLRFYNFDKFLQAFSNSLGEMLFLLFVYIIFSLWFHNKIKILRKYKVYHETSILIDNRLFRVAKPEEIVLNPLS